MKVLVTGGAGYIGSHVVLGLRRAAHEVLVVDDLSGGHADALPSDVRLERADVTEAGTLTRIAATFRPDGVVHLAAKIQVGESVARPDSYYATNVGASLRLIEVASRLRVPVVFSSTAAVYGTPTISPIPIEHACAPENPYGRSKLMCEQILRDCAAAVDFRCAVLRYFNVAGAAVDAGLSERHDPETHLIPLAIAAAIERDRPLAVFGDDWPTRDGTCVRDYVHVVDLAAAHVTALERLVDGAASFVANLGGGVGVTVREVMLAVERVVGRPVPHAVAPRRPGDVAELVADIASARALLGWEPSRSSIDRIVDDALRSLRDRRGQRA